MATYAPFLLIEYERVLLRRVNFGDNNWYYKFRILIMFKVEVYTVHVHSESSSFR